MPDRFYFEYDEVEDYYLIIKDEKRRKREVFPNDICFFVKTEWDAKEAVALLNKLYKEAHDR